MTRELRVFTGSAHPSLGESICRFLGVPVGRAHLARFSDGEVWFQIQDNVRGADVFVIQPTGPPVNENLMELLVMLDAFKRSSASRITAVMPYYGYARQDRKDKPRVPISAKLVADLLSVAGTDRILTMDLHATQIQGFFNVPVDHLFAAPVILDYVSRLKLPKLTVVSPDAGGVERARARCWPPLRTPSSRARPWSASSRARSAGSSSPTPSRSARRSGRRARSSSSPSPS